MNEVEDKVLFRDGDKMKALRGKVTKKDEHYVYLSRNDGVYEISHNVITSIFYPKENGNVEETEEL